MQRILFFSLMIAALTLPACTTVNIKDELAYGRTCQENGFPWGSAEYNFCVSMLKEKQKANRTTPPTDWIPDLPKPKP